MSRYRTHRRSTPSEAPSSDRLNECEGQPRTPHACAPFEIKTLVALYFGLQHDACDCDPRFSRTTRIASQKRRDASRCRAAVPQLWLSA